MIPPQTNEDDAPPGELMVFEELKDAPETSNWIVLHSLDIAEHSQRVSGELDFVVIIPEKGVLCLEVKSHRRIERQDGRWLFGDRKREQKSPFVQVRDAMHDLREHFQQKNPDLSDVVFWSGVVFPYVNFSECSPEWHDWQVIDRKKLKSRGIVSLVESMIQNARDYLRETPSAAWFDPGDDTLNRENCERIVDTLRHNFEVHQSPKSRAEERESEILEYTQKQYRALDTMARNPRVSFLGPAGTGKTTLAIEAARREKAKGRNVLVVCFNRYLGKWMSEQLQPLKGVSAGTLHSHMIELVDASPVGKSADFWREKLPEEAAIQAIETETEYDTLIVDEAQDLMRESYLNFLDIMVSGGLQHGRWRLFGDFANQDIYSDDYFNESDKLVSIETFTDTYNVPIYSLSENCRNKPRIASFVESLSQLEPGYSEILRRDDGVDPEVHFHDEEGDELLVEVLESLYDRDYSGEDIAVLQPSLKSDPLQGVVDGRVSERWEQRLREYSEDGEGYVTYSTIHAFKGLEAPAVVVAGFDSIDQPESRELFYVATSRAQDKLVVLAPEAIGDEMMKAITGS